MFAGAAGAATYNAYTRYNGTQCNPYTPGSTSPSTTGCTRSGENVGTYGTQTYDFTATARADTGDVGVSSRLVVDGQALSAGAGIYYGDAFAYFSDTLFFGIDEGTFHVEVDVAGSQVATRTNNYVEAVESRVNVTVASSTEAKTVYSNTITERAISPVIDTEGSLGTSVVALAFSGGKLDLTLGISTWQRCYYTGAGNVCTTSSDFLSSMRITGGEVRNTLGEIVQAGITSTTGFDYLAGLDPHVPAVPLPAALPLLFAAIGGLGLVGRRRQRKAA